MAGNRTDHFDDVVDGGHEHCVGAVVSHAENRNLLTAWLADSYDVVTPSEDVSLADVAERADLLVLDEHAFDRHADWVADYRAREGALFCPVLLLVAGDQSRFGADVWANVDDVVSLPVEKAVLHARIRGLLSRRELSRDLAASEDRFRTLFDLGPDPAVVVDEQRRVVDSNVAFRDLVGASGEWDGRRLDDLHAFDASAIDAVSRASDGEPGDDDVFALNCDGEQRYVECRRRDLDTDDGHRILILHDVTERIDHERELQRQVDRLDEFAGVLAHEMRNPLSIATGWLEQAAETGNAEAFERVETAQSRMNEMIDELLQLARRGSIIGERSTVALATLVTESWESVATDDATLVVDDELSERTVTGDPDRLQEVFANLFRNAVEHGSTGNQNARRSDDAVEHGGGNRIEVGLTDDGRGVYVADEGPGLAGADRDSLFEAGYTTAAEGTGFGLAIVKQIAEAHGWTVRATDAAGGGARFELLGLVDEDRDADRA